MCIIIYQNKDEPKVETFEITQLEIKHTHTHHSNESPRWLLTKISTL